MGGAMTQDQAKKILKTLNMAKVTGTPVVALLDSAGVKITEGAGYVKETPDRAQVWAASTPQIFKVEEYRAAVYLGQEKKLSVTDDCGLVEAVGFPVKLVDIGYQNLKITTREDLYFAEAILNMRRDAEEATS